MVGRANARRLGLKRLFFCFLAFSFFGGDFAKATSNNTLDTVVNFNLQKYVGVWYQIAHIPNRFQAMCVSDTKARYEITSSERIKVVNSCRDEESNLHQAVGVARLNAKYGNPARLEVRFAPSWTSFLPFVWGDYWVLDIDEGYYSVLVGSPDRRYLWLLAREPTLSETRKIDLVRKASAMGFDVTKLSQ